MLFSFYNIYDLHIYNYSARLVFLRRAPQTCASCLGSKIPLRLGAPFVFNYTGLWVWGFIEIPYYVDGSWSVGCDGCLKAVLSVGEVNGQKDFRVMCQGCVNGVCQGLVLLTAFVGYVRGVNGGSEGLVCLASHVKGSTVVEKGRLVD